MKRACTLLLFSTILLVTPLCFADQASDAFNDGKRLMGKAKYAEACARFAEAETAAGPNVKTRYWTGRCSEEQGKKAAAFLAYKDAKRMAIKAGDTKRAEVIDQRISELGKILPFLVLTVPPELQSIEGLTLKRDGEVVPSDQWGVPQPVDIGKHQITVSAPGYTEVTLNVTASEPGSKAQLVIPTLAKEGDGAPPPGPVTPGPAPMPMPMPPPGDGGPEMERKNAGLFWTGVGLVAGGGLALVVGTGFLVASAVEDSGIDFCDSDVEDCSSGESGPTGIGLLVVGGVFLGVGIPFMVVFGKKVPAEGAPATGGVTIQPVITPGGLRLQGTF